MRALYKQTIIRMTFLIVLFTIISCNNDFLNPDPSAVISENSFFVNEDNLEAYALGMYDAIQGFPGRNNQGNRGVQIEFLLTEMRSDNSTVLGFDIDDDAANEQSEFPAFNVDRNNSFVYNYYNSFYNVIYRANQVLANLDLTSTIEKRNKLEAEAKFIRAYAYFNLVRLFGDIPLATEVVNIDDKETQFTRIPTSEIYDLIFSDFEFAVANLENGGSKNLASKAAAQGLLAKAYLTPEGNANKNYTRAKELLEEVIASNKYSLETDFSDIFYNEDNNETIFSIGYISGDPRNGQNFSGSFLNSAAGGITANLNFATDDLVSALAKDGGDRRDKTIRIAIDNRGNEIDGVFNPNKFLVDGQEDQLVVNNIRFAGNDWIVLRYADILLLYIEAVLEGNQTTSDPKAIEYLNLVRNRAGINIPIANVKQSDLLTERRVEFAFENQRLFDLLRIGTAKADEVMRDFANSASYTSDDLLLPFPLQEINLSN